ncbi:Ioc3p KNAG_0C02070 [Huiozyma naganishii CBS 8797]|uniref:WHIM1 domain-containing protein n=1 Tax=Huiozyma naganishii (strain ATCC MYA-139 / BCRC 22969 / CBS 8797 / KCTC 17520 / NBRC 10181 / NCYC 3082 / Yp74L-3) TaxID=1071383 RepID=J7S4I9_HUIN7|nr:hypothetical protein KNAG_0C02070 [Kazachstania naganishii CBS 8797]CCK69319.1 hypothetical protein KNAG_0C02070 [Kazachstania naganishii CBS 8797]
MTSVEGSITGNTGTVVSREAESTPAFIQSNQIPNDKENREDIDKGAVMQTLGKNANTSTNTGLRRSARVPKPRVDIEIEYSTEKRPYKKRAKTAGKPGPKPKKTSKGAKTSVKDAGKNDKKKDPKPNAKKPGQVSKKSATKGSALPAQKKSTSNPISSGIGLQEPVLTGTNWASATPLLNSDFKTQHSIVSRLKSPNTIMVPYAGDIIKIMSFINKFSVLFGSDLLGLSFQDFEIGLDLYPGASSGSFMGVYSDMKQKYVLYQDILPIKDVIASQDKVTLLFVTLLKVVYAKEKDIGEPLELQDVKPFPKKAVKSTLEKLQTDAKEWGYPMEWRAFANIDRKTPINKHFEHDDTVPVDTKVPHILCPNIYDWPSNAPLEDEQNPLKTPELADKGILALQPNDRVIMLRALVDWCVTQSIQVHNQIHHLSHLKFEPEFGVQTQHVPRYLIDGDKSTFLLFKKLCHLVQNRLEIRSKKKHYKKLLRQGKQPELQKKLDTIKEIKDALQKADDPEQEDRLLTSFYDKWVSVFEGELHDNPLANPFANEVYQLRCQEFFIGRIPHMGDFYLPRLHSYGSDAKISTFTDLRTLNDILQKFQEGVYNSDTLFENFGQNMSSQFKVLYHDTPSLVRDVNKGVSTHGKVYWYEVCHDLKTLQEFIELIDLKIFRAPAKTDVTATIADGPLASKEVTPVANEPVEKPDAPSASKDKMTHDTTVNKHPLPKDPKYNLSRARLQIMKDYLSKMHFVLAAYEDLKEKYGDMKPGRRQLRRVHKLNYSDQVLDGSDDDAPSENEYQDEDLEADVEEIEIDADDDSSDEYEEEPQEVKPARRGPGRPRKRPLSDEE